MQRLLNQLPSKSRAIDELFSLNNLAIVYQRTQRLPEARQIAEQMTQIHPVYSTGWNTLGAVALEQGDHQAAEQALLRSLELNPYSSTALANLGNLEYLQGNYKDASDWWQKTLSVDPQHHHAQQGLIHLQTVINAP